MGLFKVCLMCDCVLYKILTGICGFIFLLTIATTVAAERNPYSSAPRYVPQAMNHGIHSEPNNPWYRANNQVNAQRFWSPPQNFYQEQRRRPPVKQAPYYQAPFHYSSESRQGTNKQQERYVTPEIIEMLNRQEAQYYNSLKNGKDNREMRGNYQPLYRQGMQQHSGYSTYGMGGVNPIYDAPTASPWSNAPDVLYRGEDFSWLPDEAIGGLPPINAPMFGDDKGFGGTDNRAGNMNNKVFNPFTFLQNRE